MVAHGPQEHFNVSVRISKVRPRGERADNDRVIEDLLSMTVKANTEDGAISKAIGMLSAQQAANALEEAEALGG